MTMARTTGRLACPPSIALGRAQLPSHGFSLLPWSIVTLGMRPTTERLRMPLGRPFPRHPEEIPSSYDVDPEWELNIYDVNSSDPYKPVLIMGFVTFAKAVEEMIDYV